MKEINNIFNIFKTETAPHSLLQELYPLGEIELTQQELQSMDFDFFFGVAGSRMPAPLITREGGLDENSHITTNRKNMLKEIIKVRYLKTWERIWKTLTAEYNPVENYSLVENGEDKKTGDDTTTETADPANNYEQLDTSVFAYDSGTATPSTGEKRSSSTDSESKIDYNSTTSHYLERRGNIGVTTGSQMVDSEISVRIKSNFADIIYSDLKKLLCLQIY